MTSVLSSFKKFSLSLDFSATCFVQWEMVLVFFTILGSREVLKLNHFQFFSFSYYFVKEILVLLPLFNP